jgi:hypothetical protein
MVKKQLLGETGMAEQMELDVTTSLGVTDWIDAVLSPPTLSGWYDARVKMSEEERQERQPDHQRRWWNAGTQTFSMPVTVGEECQEEELTAMSLKHSPRDLSTLEYRGLKEQHPKLTLLRKR